MSTDYIDDLTLELRMLDVPGTRIGEIIAEVEAHVAETGEDPAEAFGPVREYAAERARAAGVVVDEAAQSQHFLVRFLRGQVINAIAGVAYGAIAAWFLVNGILALVVERIHAPFGLPALASILIGAVLIAVWWGWFLKGLGADRVVDPRTGREVDWTLRGRRKV